MKIIYLDKNKVLARVCEKLVPTEAQFYHYSSIDDVEHFLEDIAPDLLFVDFSTLEEGQKDAFISFLANLKAQNGQMKIIGTGDLDTIEQEEKFSTLLSDKLAKPIAPDDFTQIFDKYRS